MGMATLITGASSGLGTEFARLAAKDGCDVVLVGRRTDALETLAEELRSQGIAATVLVADLNDPSSVHHIVNTLSQERIVIDTLINNAGVGRLAPFAETDTREIESMLMVNMHSLTLLTHALLPGMITRKRGYILNVASTAAFQPGPLMAVYYATKAYVLHWSIALGNELARTGVSVTCLCPGPTRTGFQKAAGMLESPLFKKLHTMTARDAARAGYEGMKRGKDIVTPGLLNKIASLGPRILSKTLAARIARMAQEVPSLV